MRDLEKGYLKDRVKLFKMGSLKWAVVVIEDATYERSDSRMGYLERLG